MNRLFEKVIAVMLVITLAGVNFIFLGSYSVSYALSNSEITGQTTSTENANVEFNAYLGEGEHIITANAESQDTKLHIDVKVKKSGYLKNATIAIKDANFKINGNVVNEHVQNIKNNEITLKQINNGSNITLDVPISILDTNQIPVDNFEKESKIVFNGTYIDGDGKEKKVSKEITNRISWKNEAKSMLKAEMTKFIPYAQNEKHGVMIQAKVQSGIIEGKLPIKETNIELNVPEIDNVKPTSVAVSANKTEATDGNKNGINFTSDNYAYDSETGIVKISVKNTADENGQVSWVKSVQDEYLVTFIFDGQELYNKAITEGIDLKANIASKIAVYNNEETIVETSAEYELKAEKKMGTIVDFDVLTNQEIAKGNIYANYDAKAKAETNYGVKYIATIHDLDLTESIEFKQNYDKFITSDEEEGSTTVGNKNYAYNKNVKISEEVFAKMLGEEGSIELLDENGKVIGTINKETEKDENGNYVLDISSLNNNQLIMKTSKPISVGKIEIEIEKAIKGDIDYSREQMKSFVKMKTELSGTAAETTIKDAEEIDLKEVKSIAQIEISKKNLTTVVKNENVEIRAVLDTSSLNNALYKNPTLKIKLPSYIEKLDIKSANLLMDGGLKVKSAKVEKENDSLVLNVAFEGTQTEYTIGAEYKGTILVLNTDLTVKTLTPSNKNKIEMAYTNANTVSTNKSGIVEAEVNFVAPEGIVAANGITNYAKNAKEIMSISDESKEVTIDTFTEKKIATITGKVVNNYGNKITNVVILGRLPAKDNKKIDTDESLGSTFDATLHTAIGLAGIDSKNYTIYYSNHSDATTDLANTNNGWTTKAMTTAKSYMIVTKDYEMQTGETIEFKYNIEIPANLTYNSSSYEMYKVYYTNVSSIGTMAETKTSAILGASTGEGPELQVKLESTAETVREGQIVKMKVEVKNTGSTTATNAKANITLPEYVTFMEYVTGNGFYEEEPKTKAINLGTLAPGKSARASYYIKIKNITDKVSAEADKEYPKEIVNQVNITADEVATGIPSNEYKMNVQKGKIAVEMISDTSESQVLKNNQVVEYTINVENISLAGDLKNVIVTIPLADGVAYKSAVLKDKWEDDKGITEGITYNKESNTVSVKIDTLTSRKVIILETEMQKFEGYLSMKATAKADGTEEHYSNITEYAAEIAELEVSELTSTPKYVKEGDKLTYKLKVSNKGKATIYGIKITDTLPEELDFVEATYTYSGATNKITTLKDGKVVIDINQLGTGQTTNITIVGKPKLLEDKNDKQIKNTASVVAKNVSKIETNTVTNTIEYNEELRNQQPGENPTTSKKKYKITGTAWLDNNKNGKRDQDEEILADIPVVLIYKKDNSVVKDPDTKQEMRTKTGSNGTYQFNNVPNGQYLVLFLYDASKYSLTSYHVKEVDEGVNSDAIDINITFDGERRVAGITDVIKVTDSNIRDIDIGLYSAEKFDLRLDKYVSKITLTTPTIGTTTYTYNNEQTTKVEVLEKNIGESSIVIEYKIVVKNEGAVSGYVKKVVDYLPAYTKFSTELNKDWYLSENGNVYNSSLANEKIEPGQSKEMTLILTAKITEESIGKVINNNAEIYESYNEQGLKDIDSTPGNKASEEDDMSKADVVLGIVTGKPIMYITLALGIIVLLGFGIYEIKKRVLIKTKD